MSERFTPLLLTTPVQSLWNRDMLSLGNVNMNKLHGSWHVNKALYFVKTLSIHRCGKQKLCFTKLSRTISKLRECPQAHIRLWAWDHTVLHFFFNKTCFILLHVGWAWQSHVGIDKGEMDRKKFLETFDWIIVWTSRLSCIIFIWCQHQ